MDDLDRLGLDDHGRLYWDDKPVATGVRLSSWQALGAVVTVVSAASVALVALADFVIKHWPPIATNFWDASTGAEQRFIGNELVGIGLIHDAAGVFILGVALAFASDDLIKSRASSGFGGFSSSQI